MNERTKQLYEQSLSRVNKTDHDGNPVMAIHQDPEKFAELIVKECIDIAHSEGDNVAYLKDYFGVK